ncbi:hypothetical protein FEM48_Zijuj05G0156000 [Ziziphus jujuba var. spinosa]|uniref:Protein NRT1/ PTR FAMILY 2.11-like n=1 Tax=Ziziphus jujuba var. spinosa TaxID=714518 RepID=A0A978VFN0_ZIZJJ|nr:hypothetical protein FEM48_Zijuj05G0156000 [Ziziphus jujuba var. spinosa]
MPFVIGNETFEKLGAIGTLSNLLIYLTTVFNMKSITAANILNIFNGTTNLATLIGAYLSDTYFGRCKTLGFASLASLLSNVSWALGLAIPAILMFISCALFFMGLKIFVKVKANGSPITSLAQVIVVSIKKRKLKLPEQPRISLFAFTSSNSINSRLPYTHQFRFLDKAAILTPEDKINEDGSAANPWRLCSMQQVEEVKCVVRVLPIWVSAVIYHIAIVQQHTYSVFQAVQSDRRVGKSSFKIPAASYYVFLMLSMTIWIPIYDRIVVPSVKKLRGKQGGITLLQRVGFGIFLTILCMLVSALVEDRRRSIAHSKPTLGVVPRKGAVSSMSALWLIPQLAIAGFAEAFTAIGQVEFYYKQFPENMRSVAGALFFCGMAVSSYLSSFLISIVHTTTQGSHGRTNWLPEDLNQGRLDCFYYLIGALEVVNLAYFLVCSKWYKYKGSDSAAVVNGMELASRNKHGNEKESAV